MIITGNFEHFRKCNFEADFLANENLYQKREYHFLVESTKIENAHFHTKLSQY